MGKRKLTDEQRAAIRQEYAAGATQTALAEKHGIVQQTVSRVLDAEGYRERQRVQKTNWLSKPSVRARQAARNAASRAANPEKHRASVAVYRAANPEKHRANTAAWRTKFPEKARAQVHRRKARKRNAPGESYTPAHYQAALAVIWKHECAYCRATDRPLHIEHVVPLSRGGSNELANLVPACGKCNLSKGTKLLAEWRGGSHAHIAAFAAEVAASVGLILEAAGAAPDRAA